MYAEYEEPKTIPPFIVRLSKFCPDGRSAKVYFFQRIEQILNGSPASLKIQAIRALIRKSSVKVQNLDPFPAEIKQEICAQEEMINEYYADILGCLERGYGGFYSENEGNCLFDILTDFAGRENTSFYFLETLRLVAQLKKEWFAQGFSQYGHGYHTVGAELLAQSVTSGNYFFVKWLLNLGVDPNCSVGNRSIIERAVEHRADRLDIIQLLVDNSASVFKSSNLSSHGKNAPLWTALNRRNYKCAAWLIAKGANINELDTDNCSILMENVASGSIEGATLLLQAGADVNLRNNLGRTALFAACGRRYGNAESLELLLNYGADIDARDLQLQTSLMHASKEGNVGNVKLLLAAGAHSNAKDSNGENALFYALSRCRCDENVTSILKALRIHRTDIDSRNNQGMHVVDFALAQYKKARAYGFSTQEYENAITYLMSEKPQISISTRIAVFYQLKRKKIWTTALGVSAIAGGAYLYHKKYS